MSKSIGIKTFSLIFSKTLILVYSVYLLILYCFSTLTFFNINLLFLVTSFVLQEWYYVIFLNSQVKTIVLGRNSPRVHFIHLKKLASKDTETFSELRNLLFNIRFKAVCN